VDDGDLTMPYEILPLNQAERSRQKDESRARDESRLQSGQVSREQLTYENGFASAFDLPSFRIAAIGNRAL
jgi:hypothetical protein